MNDNSQDYSQKLSQAIIKSPKSSFIFDAKSYFGNNEIGDQENSEEQSMSKFLNDVQNTKFSSYSNQMNSESNENFLPEQSLIWGQNNRSQDSLIFYEKCKKLKKQEDLKRKKRENKGKTKSEESQNNCSNNYSKNNTEEDKEKENENFDFEPSKQSSCGENKFSLGKIENKEVKENKEEIEKEIIKESEELTDNVESVSKNLKSPIKTIIEEKKESSSETMRSRKNFQSGKIPIYISTGIKLEDEKTEEDNQVYDSHSITNDESEKGKIDMDKFRSNHKRNKSTDSDYMQGVEEFSYKFSQQEIPLKKTIESEQSLNNTLSHVDEVMINKINTMSLQNNNISKINNTVCHKNRNSMSQMSSEKDYNQFTPSKINNNKLLFSNTPYCGFSNNYSSHSQFYNQNLNTSSSNYYPSLNYNSNSSNIQKLSIPATEKEILNEKVKTQNYHLKIPTEESFDSFYSANNPNKINFNQISHNFQEVPNRNDLKVFSASFTNPNNSQYMGSQTPKFQNLYLQNQTPTNSSGMSNYYNMNTISHINIPHLTKPTPYSSFITSTNYNTHNSNSTKSTKDSKLEDFKIEDYVTGKEKRTTLMIRNVPNRYDVDQILTEIDELGFKNKYDCFYLPIDSIVSSILISRKISTKHTLLSTLFILIIFCCFMKYLKEEYGINLTLESNVK